MKSHTYAFETRDVIEAIALPLMPAGLVAVLLHVAALSHLLPLPKPMLDTDRVILCHQAAAAESQAGADILLIGDSSCMTDVDALQLEIALKGNHHVLNLGTLSYLDLQSYGELLRRYVSANPGQPRAVVLLMHPEALRRAGSSEAHSLMLRHLFERTDFCEPATAPLVCWMGGPIFKGRLLARTVPLPLGGEYGRTYGFTHDLWDYLSEHHGSAFDPRHFDPKTAQGNAEYRLVKATELGSQSFRQAMPGGVKLLVGITPTPGSFVTADFAKRHGEMLRQWSGWLGTDGTLSELPATWPDDLFASSTHLNREGTRRYTELLARALQRISLP